MGWREDVKFNICRISDLYLGTGNGDMGTQVTATAAELNIMDGVTATAAELNILDGVTSTAAELNILDGVTATAAELNYLDLTSLGVAEDSKALVFDANGKVDFAVMHGGTAAANSLLMGGGTTADPMTTATADKSFIEFRCQSTATSGDSRLLYGRFDLNGAGVSGECVRAFTKLTAIAATARGAHISLDITAAMGVTGLGAGVDAQVLMGDGAISGGTVTALNIEWYAAGASTDVSGATTSFIRCVLGGNATGAANIEDNATFLTVTGGSNASGNVVGAVVASPTLTNAYPIRVSLNGTTTYLVAATVS